MAGERQIETPRRESLGMGGLFSAYWEGMGEERGREGGTETEREEEREGDRGRGCLFRRRQNREKGRTNGDLLALVGRRRLGVGGACRLKGQVYPGDRADQQNYNYNIPVFFL